MPEVIQSLPLPENAAPPAWVWLYSRQMKGQLEMLSFKFSWGMGSSLVFLPLLSFISCTSLCTGQRDPAWLKSWKGKIGKYVGSFSRPAFSLFPYFLIPIIPQTFPFLPTIHSNFWLSLNAKDIFPTYWEISMIWGLPGLDIDILKSSRLEVRSQRLLSCWKILFCMLKADITLLFGCHFFLKQTVISPWADGWLQTERAKLFIVWRWFPPVYLVWVAHQITCLFKTPTISIWPWVWAAVNIKVLQGESWCSCFILSCAFLLNFEKHICSASLK